MLEKMSPLGTSAERLPAPGSRTAPPLAMSYPVVQTDEHLPAAKQLTLVMALLHTRSQPSDFPLTARPERRTESSGDPRIGGGRLNDNPTNWEEEDEAADDEVEVPGADDPEATAEVEAGEAPTLSVRKGLYGIRTPASSCLMRAEPRPAHSC